jgi:hypothetical protein
VHARQILRGEQKFDSGKKRSNFAFPKSILYMLISFSKNTLLSQGAELGVTLDFGTIGLERELDPLEESDERQFAT